MTKTARIFTISTIRRHEIRHISLSTTLGSGSHLGLGRDADRRKKTGCRRRIVIKEDLDAEDRKRMAVPGELLCRAQHRLSHTYTVTCISLSSPPTLSGLTCIYPWTGVVRDILGSPILKFPQEPAVYFNFSLVEMPTEERRLVEEEGSQTKKTWLQKKEDSKEEVSSCLGPCSFFW